MKKRMIAILLSLSILCSSLFCVKRASAAAAITGGFSIFLVAWEMLDLMTKGEVPGFVQVIQWCGERVAEGAVLTWEFFTDPDGGFQQAWGDFWDNWQYGYESICDNLGAKYEVDASNLFDTNGNLRLSYDDFYDLYRQAVEVMSNSDINFTAGYNYTFLSCNVNAPILISDIPTISEFFNSASYESYVPVYFNDETVIFCGNYFKYGLRDGYKHDVSMHHCISDYSFSTSLDTGTSIVDNLKLIGFEFNGLSDITYINNSSGHVADGSTASTSKCAVFDGNKLTFCNISDVDITGMNSGIITTTGNYADFLRSVEGFAVSGSNGAELDDLSGVLPIEKNPTLTFPSNPDLDKPLANQVIVGDVPGAADLPVSDYLKAVTVPAAAPPVILTKFPFCIPYDFVRFIGFLAADPIPPVFHIPISTSPENLEQWASNETIGQYVAPDDPLFEINEEIVIDFAHIPLVQPICYTCFIVGFVILLIHITPKLIHH